MRAQLLYKSSVFFAQKYGHLQFTKTQFTKIFVLIQKPRTGKESFHRCCVIYESLISSQPTKAYVTHKEMNPSERICRP